MHMIQMATARQGLTLNSLLSPEGPTISLCPFEDTPFILKHVGKQHLSLLLSDADTNMLRAIFTKLTLPAPFISTWGAIYLYFHNHRVLSRMESSRALTHGQLGYF